MDRPFDREQRLWRYRIFVLTWLAYAGFYFCRRNFSIAMVPLTEDLGFTKMDLANALLLYHLMYAIGQFYSGVLSDRFGPRLVVGIGLFVAVGSNILMGFGTSLIMFAILNALNGSGQSTGWSGTVKNMAYWFRQRERGIVMGWWCSCYVLGGFLATVYATFFITQFPFFSSLGWRRGFWAPAFLVFLVAWAYIVFTRNRPGDAGLPPIAEEEIDVSGDRTTHTKKNESQRSLRDIIGTVLSNPVVWLISIMYFFMKITRYSFLYWLPLYMREQLGYSQAEAGYFSSLYELVGFTGVIIAGYVSDKLMGSRRMPVGAMMMWGLALMCLLHPKLAALGYLGNAAGICLIGIFTYGPDSLMAGAGAIDAGSQSGAGTAAGFMNGVGSFGQVISSYLVAFVADTYGWDSVFYLFVLFALIGGCLLAVKWNWLPQKPEPKMLTK